MSRVRNAVLTGLLMLGGTAMCWGADRDGQCAADSHFKAAPAAALDAPGCPPDSYVGVGQPAFGEDQAWQIYVSNDRWPEYDPAAGVLLYERFAGTGAPPESGGIRDIHW